VARQRLVSSAAEALPRLVFYSLLTLIALTAIPNGTEHVWFKAVFQSVVFTLVGLWIIEGLFSGTWRLPDLHLLAPGACLLILAIIQAIAGSWQLGFELVSSVASYETRLWVFQAGAILLMAALLLQYTNNQKRFKALVHVVISIGALSAFYGLFRQLTLSPPPWSGVEEPTAGYAQFLNPNHFALLMEMTLGLTVGLIIAGGVKRRSLFVYLPVSVLLWTTLVLSNSRGGILSMVGQVVVVAFLIVVMKPPKDVATTSNEQAEDFHGQPGPKKTPRLNRTVVARVSLAFLLLTIIVGGAFWVGGDSLRRRLQVTPREFANETPTRSNSNRLAIWRATISLIKDNPITGVGLGAYSTAIPRYHDASGTWIPEEAHNDYLELLATGGIIGFSLVVWFGIVCYRRGRRNLLSPGDQFSRAARLGSLIGLTGVGIHSHVDFGLHITVNAVICISLIVVLTRTLSPNAILEPAS
jgi:O-antigen ligase